MSVIDSRKWLRDFDWTMTALVLAISVLGMVQIYSSTLHTSFQRAYGQHTVWIAMGLALFWIASQVDYHKVVALSILLWVTCVVALVAILLFADPVNGARRWLPTPFGVSVQVSEFMKAVLVLVLAKRFATHAAGPAGFRTVAVTALLFCVPFLLVLKQPDLSTALSMCPIFGVPVLLSRLRKRYIAIACLLVLLLLPLGWSLLEPYQKDRLTAFLDPDDSPRSTGYQILQSKIAVGAGGMWGQGFVQGSQTQLHFLPTPHTDFILASFAEERGFAGVAVLLALYYFLLMRIVRTARSAADMEGMLIAMSVAGLLLFHIVVNVGMVVNKLPVTGLPLPLMSYGGSSCLTVLAMLGLVNNVRRCRFVN